MHTSSDDTPIADSLIALLRRYGDALFTDCPSSEELVLYAEEADELTADVGARIAAHVTVCSDCRDRVRWCQELL